MFIFAAINWHSFFFLLFALLSCGFALCVLLSSNVVRMAFYLIVSLASTAGLFFLAGAKFVGAMQIMIYVGGTLVLLIFGVMLTAQASFVSMKTKSSDWVLAAISGGALLALLFFAANSVEGWQNGRSTPWATVKVGPPTATRWSPIWSRTAQAFLRKASNASTAIRCGSWIRRTKAIRRSSPMLLLSPTS